MFVIIRLLLWRVYESVKYFGYTRVGVWESVLVILFGFGFVFIFFLENTEIKVFIDKK